MKKRIIFLFSLIVVCFLYSVIPAIAQKYELIPYTGYMTSAHIDAYQGFFRVNDGLNLGAAFNISFSEGYKIEVSYNRTSSELNYNDGNKRTEIGDLVVHYVSIGGLLELNQRNTVVPFLKVGLGGTYYQTTVDSIGTEHVMHFDISGGTKIYFSDHIGLRLQASLLLPVFFEGIYFEEAAPASGQGMKTEISGIQGDFTAGVIFRF